MSKKDLRKLRRAIMQEYYFQVMPCAVQGALLQLASPHVANIHTAVRHAWTQSMLEAKRVVQTIALHACYASRCCTA